MNTNELLSAIKRNITVPTYQPRFSTDDLLALAFEEQKTTIVPMIIGISQNYFLFTETVPLPTNTFEVPFPYRAVANASKNVIYDDGQNNPRQLINLRLSQVINLKTDLLGEPASFLVYNDRIRLYPRPLNPATLKFVYYINPSRPVQLNRVSNVTAVGIDTLTLVMVPSNITVGSPIDITKARSGFSLTYIDQTVTNIAGNTITLSGFSALNPITNVNVGDYVSTAEETGILQLPSEAQDVLVQAVAVRVLQALNVPDQLDIAEKRYDEKREYVQLIMAPRIEDQTDVLNSGHPLIGLRNYITMPRVNV